MNKGQLNTHKPRVYTLYRVSTKSQVDKDDIPMQKECCREFAKKKGWEITKEFYEKGVSGYKVSAKNRDVILEIQAAAAQGEFDILLVYMFDRLGRKDDETPFVVQWFVENGIEVWSTIEGQQRFDNQLDKLINYMRYWQANGESVKTSIRIKTRKSQLAKEGVYMGGTPPYGYYLEKRGQRNKRDMELNELSIEEDEALVVRLIFQKYAIEGYGSLQLSHFLYDNGYRNRNGNYFPKSTIIHMLKNRRYLGIVTCGEVESDIIPELQIITPELFDKAQSIMNSRVKKCSDVPYNTSGHSLLSGLLYCENCGSKLTVGTSGCKPTPDGAPREYKIRYYCSKHILYPKLCSSQSFSAPKLDGIVEDLVKCMFSNISTFSEAEFIGNARKKSLDEKKNLLTKLEKELFKERKDLNAYTEEIAKSVRGESNFDQTILNNLFKACHDDISAKEHEEASLKAELDELQNSIAGFKEDYTQLLTWATMFDGCTLEAKKTIVHKL